MTDLYGLKWMKAWTHQHLKLQHKNAYILIRMISGFACRINVNL